MDNKDLFVAQKKHNETVTRLSQFYRSLIKDSKLFKKLAMRDYQDKYLAVQDLKKKIKDYDTNLDSYLETLNRYESLSKSIIISVAYLITKKDMAHNAHHNTIGHKVV